LPSMLLNELQQQARQNQRQAEEIRYLNEQSNVQAARSQRLSMEAARLKRIFGQVIAAQREGRSIAATFNH
jgi:hypothetical protein